MQHPFAVAPPETASGVVVVFGLVRETVVVSVQSDPLNWAALAGQGAHDHQDTFKPNGHNQAAVSYQTVQSEGDPQNGDPVEDTEGNNRTPAPELGEQSNGCQDVVDQHEAGGAPFDLALTSW